MSGHTFISYSHRDRAYIARLKTCLQNAGLAFWTDEGIERGAEWARTIEQMIRSCSAFVPVMSIDSREARWVTREINLAQDAGKPILPLLLSGRVFFELRDLQAENVTSGEMPSHAFVKRLRTIPRPSSLDGGKRTERTIHELLSRIRRADKVGKRGDHVAAVGMLREVISEANRSLWSPEYIVTEAMHPLAINLDRAGDHVEAERILRDLVSTHTSVFGADFITTLIVRRDLAVNLGERGNRTEALDILRQVVAGFTKSVGANHSLTNESVKLLRQFGG